MYGRLKMKEKSISELIQEIKTQEQLKDASVIEYGCGEDGCEIDWGDKDEK